MKTRASIMGHPVHMGLAHFPVAFLIGAFAFDAGAKALGIGELVVVAAYLLLVGVAAGVLAAVPGMVDFLTSVPPAARGRATRHLAVSVLALLTFMAAWFMRGGIAGNVGATVLILEAFGALLISVSGFLGGSLVLKDRIGVHLQADTMPR
jgi:uncharacterized membrane protein